MSTDSEKIVNLENWKLMKKDNHFSEYLKVLSFNDLMNESNELIKQINGQANEDDLFSKTRLLMNEFTLRLEKESRTLAESVKDLKRQIEDKLH